MALKKPRGYGYIHVTHTPRKRPGRHAKHYGKRIPRKAKNRGQGRVN